MPSTSDSFSCATTYTPVAIGTYIIKYFVDCDNLEDLTTNDTIYNSFKVTDDFTYSRDKGWYTGYNSNVISNTGQPFLIGNVMQIFQEDWVYSIDARVSSSVDNIGQKFMGRS